VSKNFNKKLISFFLVLGVLFFARFVLAQDFGTAEVNTGLGNVLSSDDPRTIIGRIINIGLGLLGVIAFGFIIYAGFVWMMSNGDEEKISQAKAILKNGVIGLLIILASWAIATFILTKFSGAINGGIGSNNCTNGETSSCGCGGSMFCSGGSWGGCVGSDCGNYNRPTSCDSSVSAGCQAANQICASEDYCSDNCTCVTKGSLGASCDADLNTPTCDADNNRCGEYLSCNPDSCLCEGPPVITEVSPVGGFCREDKNKSCQKDADCSTVCDVNTPNGSANNLITIFGKNFGEYSATSSKVVFLGNSKEALAPININPDCINFWQNEQIIIAVPEGVATGAIEVVNIDNLNDTTDNEYGPQISDFQANNISRPGLCLINPNIGALSSEITYQGVNLYASRAYFGSYQSNVQSLESKFNNQEGLSGVAITPNIKSGVSGSFVVSNVSGNKEKSNYLRFTKQAEPGEGPYIVSFSPQEGKAGQYVTIYGHGFGGARGNNHVYFDSKEASYLFPTICANSIWSDRQIIVKVPDGLENGDYSIRISLGDKMIDTQKTNPNVFTIDNNSVLKPSLCKIDPVNGPVNTPVKLYGEYFGEIGREATVQFSPNEAQRVSAKIRKENEANIIETGVPLGSVTGPVRVIKNNVWGNELNFEVSSCTVDADCGAQICCPSTTYKKGRCVNTLNDCLINIPTSVFEWNFSTGTSKKFSSCSTMKDYYGTCQTGSFCPNVPGVCSPYAGGAKKIVATCDYSCATVLGCGGLGSSSCFYDANLNKCIKSGEAGICSLSKSITYTIDSVSFVGNVVCNKDKKWEMKLSSSCPSGWIKGVDNTCSDPLSECNICDEGLVCEKVGDEGKCVSKMVCPSGAICEDNPDLSALDSCVVTEQGSCNCCCRIGKSSEDCCVPLQCAGTCGEDKNANDNSGYGKCSGCADVGTTAEDHDAACNCSGHSGQYCEINNDSPQGICVDCASLSGQNCIDHSSVCCLDSRGTSDTSDDICQNGSGKEITDDNTKEGYGYCAYYNCELDDSKKCATSTPSKIGDYTDVSSCAEACLNADPCSGIQDQESCSSKSRCCFDSKTASCKLGEKLTEGTDTGYCAYYNCATLDDLVTQTKDCNAAPVKEGTFSNFESCQARCAGNEGGVGKDCVYPKLVNKCDNSVCNYPGFSCLSEIGETGFPDCGACCCNPLDNNACKTEDNPNLHCEANKGNCSGAGRGLCCGCSSDQDCGSKETVGCGIDSCCQARPLITGTQPENLAKNVCRNSSVVIEFDQLMDFASLKNNILLLEENTDGNGVCPKDTILLSDASFKKYSEEKETWFARMYSNLLLSFQKIISPFSGQALADKPNQNSLYCSVLGVTSTEIKNNRTSVIFSPKKLLAPNTNYYLVVLGDAQLNSQSGVLNIQKIGFNGVGYLDLGTTIIPSGQIMFNGKAYANSEIKQFTTLSDRGNDKGICEIDNISVSPSSYLFKTIENSIDEDDNNYNSSSFDSKQDKDKLFVARANSADGQILNPVSGYFWDFEMKVEDPDIVEIKALPGLPNNKAFVQLKEGIAQGETRVTATINMNRFIQSTCVSGNCVCQGTSCANNCCNDISRGNEKSKSSDIYIFICDNPWPAFAIDGSWSPWKDNCDAATGACDNHNYKFYYCRDAGAAGPQDDLPAISSDAIIRGKSSNLFCSLDKSECSVPNSPCGLNNQGVCIWDVLKESYFFRETSN